MFEPVTRNIFRWKSLDPESGLMMNAHLLLKDGKAVLVDPMAMPDLIPMIRILGEPIGIIMTNHPHLRGSPFLSRQFNIPLFFPDIKEVDEDESLTKMFIDLYNMKHGQQYGEKTKLPLGISAINIPGRHEFALKFEDYLIVGDSAYGVKGNISFYPSGIWDDQPESKTRTTAEALIPVIEKSGAKGLLAGHNDDIPSGLQELVRKSPYYVKH